MKKILVAILSIIACVCLIFGLSACGNNNSNVGDNSNINDGSSNINNGNNVKPVEKPLPTAKEIVAARKNAVDETIQGYDFTLNFTGDFNILGLGKSLNGNCL